MKIYNTRKDMLIEVPLYAKVCEIGVFKGEFAEQIYDICKPSEFYLIDAWQGFVMSGDVDGNNVEYYFGEELQKIVESKFSDKSGIKIIKDYSDVLYESNDNYFDFIYIDADHSYEGVKNDLECSYRKIKNGGIIAGHDYEFNFQKAKQGYDFGVKKAVDEFCQKYNLEINMKALDGCVSFGISVKK